MDAIVAFPWQRLLQKSATITYYTYIAYLIYLLSSSNLDSIFSGPSLILHYLDLSQKLVYFLGTVILHRSEY